MTGVFAVAGFRGFQKNEYLKKLGMKGVLSTYLIRIKTPLLLQYIVRERAILRN